MLNDTKVAFSSLKRVTEAEPTFASTWNRATRSFRRTAAISNQRGEVNGERTGTRPPYFAFQKCTNHRLIRQWHR